MNRLPQCAMALAAALVAMPAASPLQAESREMGEFRGVKPTEYPTWFKESFLDFTEDVNEAAAAGKRVMVLFHQDGCPYCNALVERNLSQRDIEQQVRENFDVVAINMWGDRDVVTVDGRPFTEKNFAAALKVQFTPTILFFNERGELALRLDGYLPPERFKLALDYVAQKKEREIGYREYAAARAPAAASGELNAEAFCQQGAADLSRRPADKPVAVLFEQKQCPNCDTLHEKVLADPETRDIASRFTCVQLDMWADTPVVTPAGEKLTAREWARRLDVKYAPSIVLFDAAGSEIIRSEAFFKIFHTQSIFDYVLSGGYREEPSFQRYLSARADHIREQGRDVDIWR